MTDETKKRPPPLSIRLRKGREAEFAAMVAAHGKSANAFINDLIYDRRLRSAKDEPPALELARHAAIADLVRQLEPLADRHPEIKPLVAALWLQLGENRAACLKQMRRKP